MRYRYTSGPTDVCFTITTESTAPFERFAVRVEFHCRRLLVDHSGIDMAEGDTKKQNEDIADELDEMFAA